MCVFNKGILFILQKLQEKEAKLFQAEKEMEHLKEQAQVAQNLKEKVVIYNVLTTINEMFWHETILYSNQNLNVRLLFYSASQQHIVSPSCKCCKTSLILQHFDKL